MNQYRTNEMCGFFSISIQNGARQQSVGTPAGLWRIWRTAGDVVSCTGGINRPSVVPRCSQRSTAAAGGRSMVCRRKKVFLGDGDNTLGGRRDYLRSGGWGEYHQE